MTKGHSKHTCPSLIFPCNGPLSPVCFTSNGPCATISSICCVNPGKVARHSFSVRERLLSVFLDSRACFLLVFGSHDEGGTTSWEDLCPPSRGVLKAKYKQKTARQKPMMLVICLSWRLRRGFSNFLSPMAYGEGDDDNCLLLVVGAFPDQSMEGTLGRYRERERGKLGFDWKEL